MNIKTTQTQNEQSKTEALVYTVNIKKNQKRLNLLNITLFITTDVFLKTKKRYFSACTILCLLNINKAIYI